MVNLPNAESDNENDGREILAADTLAILNEFLREKALNESNEAAQVDGVDRTFGENWVSK